MKEMIKKKAKVFWDQRYLMLLTLPVIIWMLIFNYTPMMGIIIAFKDFNPASGFMNSPWVGLDNFKELFSDPIFPHVLFNTIKISFARIIFGFPAPIIFALLLNELLFKKFKKIVQTLSYLPYFISWVMVVGFMYTLFDTNTGVVGSLLVKLNIINGYDLLMGDPKYFLPLVILSDIWKNIGWNSIIYLAAIAGIDPNLYEAAVIDGAGRIKRIWHIVSINDATDAARGGIVFWPRVFSLANYKYVFQNSDLISAFIVTIARTVLGTVVAVFFTAGFAYGVSKDDLLGRKFIIIMAMITMYFSGGTAPSYLIPNYILITKYLHLKHSFLAYILPNMFNAFNAIIMLTFFKGISTEIQEAAKIDGANDLMIFLKIVLPISKPVLATIALYNGVFHWNSWFDAMLYGGDRLRTLQQILMQIINSNSNVSIVASNLGFGSVTSESVKLATMFITTLPIVFSYPFLQKYFIKGIMIGSIKG